MQKLFHVGAISRAYAHVFGTVSDCDYVNTPKPHHWVAGLSIEVSRVSGAVGWLEYYDAEHSGKLSAQSEKLAFRKLSTLGEEAFDVSGTITSDSPCQVGLYPPPEGPPVCRDEPGLAKASVVTEGRYAGGGNVLIAVGAGATKGDGLTLARMIQLARAILGGRVG